MTWRPLMIAAAVGALGLTGCDSSIVKAAREEVGDPDAPVEAVRIHWTPQYQKAACGRILVGGQYRRFVTLLTSEGKPVRAMVEGPDLDAKTAFGDVIWGPICGGF